MDPNTARVLWTLIHSNGSLVDKGKMTQEAFAEFFRLLVEEKQLPCEKCRIDTVEHISSNPIKHIAGSRNTYLRWTFDFHNAVNKKLNKEMFPWDRCLSIYTNNNVEFAPCSAGCKSINVEQQRLNSNNLITTTTASYVDEFFPPISTEKQQNSSYANPTIVAQSKRQTPINSSGTRRKQSKP